MFDCLKNFPDSIFFEDSQKKKITFKEWKQRIDQTSDWLAKFSLKENSLVLIQIENPIDFLTVSFACMTQKIIPCFLNCYFKENQIQSLIKDNDYDLCITDNPDLKIDLQKKIFSLEEILKIIPSEKIIPLNSKMVFYSSGSIQSKACVLTLENMLYNALGSHENIPFETGNSWGASLPLFHVGGFSIFVRSLLKKGTVHWINKDSPLSVQIQQNQFTHLSLVSTQLIRLIQELKKTQTNISSLKYLLLGGSSIAQHHIQDALKLKLPILKSYGMTEMGSQICTTKILNKASDSSGHVLKYRELKIEDRNIMIRGPCLFQGYMKKNKIHLPLQDEWFQTNDLGEIKDGELFVLGRKDRIFQSAGENISPELIEKEILKIKGVEKIYILPENDPEYGQRAVGYVETSQELNHEYLHAVLREKFSLFWRPKEFRPWESLPKKSWKL